MVWYSCGRALVVCPLDIKCGKFISDKCKSTPKNTMRNKHTHICTSTYTNPGTMWNPVSILLLRTGMCAGFPTLIGTEKMNPHTTLQLYTHGNTMVLWYIPWYWMIIIFAYNGICMVLQCNSKNTVVCPKNMVLKKSFMWSCLKVLKIWAFCKNVSRLKNNKNQITT